MQSITMLRHYTFCPILEIDMSFRQKNKQRGADNRNWDAFCEANMGLIESVGLPITAVETLNRFYDFLEHGYLERYEDPLGFTIDELDPHQRDLFKVLLERYLEAGFHAWGISAWMVGGEESYMALVRQYPNQFSPYDVKHAEEAGEESALKAKEAWKE
jgi:hypothetical protein